MYFTQNTSIIEADQVPGSAFSLPLKHFCAGNLQVDHDWSQGRLCKLTGMVDGVTVHHDQLHCATQLENSLNLGLNFGQIRCSRTVFLQNFPVWRIIEDWSFAEGKIHRHVGDDIKIA